MLPSTLLIFMHAIVSFYAGVEGATTCPKTHRFAYRNGKYCCHTSRQCNGRSLSIRSTCCENRQYRQCRGSKCQNYRTVTRPSTGCKDQKRTSSCKRWKTSGYCTTKHVKYMRDNCKKTCGHCVGGSSGSRKEDMMYKAHNNERSRIGKPNIAKDTTLEGIVKSDGCRTNHALGHLKGRMLAHCSKYGHHGVAENIAIASWNGHITSIQGWIDEKTFLVGGVCPASRLYCKCKQECGHYANAFHNGKRVGCSFLQNCKGWKAVGICIYCT